MTDDRFKASVLDCFDSEDLLTALFERFGQKLQDGEIDRCIRGGKPFSGREYAVAFRATADDEGKVWVKTNRRAEEFEMSTKD